jgi:hypothetical protein
MRPDLLMNAHDQPSMNTPEQPVPHRRREDMDYESEVKAQSAGDRKSIIRGLLSMAIAIAASGAVYALARSGLYTAGDDIGYNLGLAGALAMLVLLFYPARKRIGALRRVGRLNRWFSLHMVLGIIGPILILLHCTLRWSSLNAAVAFWCMVIVASSGFIGRYLYARLHVGLYGRQLSLTEVRTTAATLLRKVNEQLQMDELAGMRPIVNAFTTASGVVAVSGWKKPIAMLMLSPRAVRARRQCRRLRSEAIRSGHPVTSPDAMDLVAGYILAVQRSAQFLPLERLFSLWHVLHLPLVFIMVLSVIAHIIAVHLY